MKYFLAIDIGASSGRHMLGWVEGGKLHFEEIYRFSNRIREKDGLLCWHTKALFSEIIKGMKKCAEINKIPYSVGIDTWGVDFVILDEENHVIGNAVSYRDRRTVGMDDEVAKRFSDGELYERTGIQKAAMNTIYQLAAVNANGGLVNAKKMLLLPDFFHFLLCGVAKTEYTNATTTGLVNAASRDWDYDIIEKCGYPKEIFCEIVPPGTVLGGLLPEVEEAVGYNCQVILPATHDTASAVVALPEDDTIFISSGTWSLMGVELESPDCSEQSRDKNFTNEGGYNFTYRYLKNIMGLWLIQSVKKEYDDKFSFEELSEMAEASGVKDAIDTNDHRLFSPTNMIKTIQKICAESKITAQEPGEIAAVIYNSLAQSYKNSARELEQITGKKYNKICIVGGGVKTEYLTRLTEAFTKKEILTGKAEATAIGNLAVQMITAGVFADLAEARTYIK
ncbi:MAG: rhamnulokinase [Defluviitaleaceae bacterium]|nr:rhamnulokinase [Defluviitaleaceae bacterium]